MPASAADLFQLIGFIQDDLRATQAKLVELRAHLSNLNLPAPQKHPCPVCGVDRPTNILLLEHLANVHDNPNARKQLTERDQTEEAA